MDVSELITENLLCKARYIAMRINSPTYSLSLLPFSGARMHSFSLLMESLAESRTRFFTDIWALLQSLFIRAKLPHFVKDLSM